MKRAILETIEDLWIILDTGIVLFSFLEDQEVDPDIFGAIISVLDNFAEATLEGGLEFFEIDPNIYGVIKKHHLIFLASAPQKIKIDKLLAELEIIVTKFFSIYPIDTKEKWDGNLYYFCEFKDEIEKIKLL
jgi:hypothetical protein